MSTPSASNILHQSKLPQSPLFSRKPWTGIFLVLPRVMPSWIIPNSGYPLWHESEELNPLCERVSGRDSDPFMNRLHNAWNGALNFSSLSGILYLGITGFQAAHHHAPNSDGRGKYVNFEFPHIAIDGNLTPGSCRRSGRRTLSQPCGALIKVLLDCSQGEISLDLNPDDVEQSPPHAMPVGKIWIRRISRFGHPDKNHPPYSQRRS